MKITVYDETGKEIPLGQALTRAAIISALEAYRIVRGSGVSEPLRAVDVVGIADAIMETTPARAEAQEGAAGEEAMRAAGYTVGLISTLGNPVGTWGFTTSLFRDTMKGFRTEKEAWTAAATAFEWEKKRAREFLSSISAHPSPPPAADEDRVRIACETARDALKCEGPEHDLIYQRDRSALDRIATGPNLQRAIAAALKSTAAKEGG